MIGKSLLLCIAAIAAACGLCRLFRFSAINGRLLFQGGIIPERVSAGDSVTVLRDALRNGTFQPGRASVFRCPIFRLRPTG